MTRAHIYGHDLGLYEPAEGGLVTDVVVLARVVRYDDDGDATDSLLVSSTRNTGGIVLSGILSAALSATEWEHEDTP